MEMAIAAKEAEILRRNEESESFRHRTDLRYQPMIERLQEAIIAENDNIALKSAKLFELSATVSSWNDTLNRLLHADGIEGVDISPDAMEMVKEVLEEKRKEIGKAKLVEIQKQLQESTFELKELSVALEHSLHEERNMEEEVKQSEVNLARDSDELKVRLKELMKTDEELLSAIKALEDAQFERKRQEKKRMNENYRMNAFRIGNKVPPISTKVGPLHGDAQNSVLSSAREKVLQSREARSQREEDAKSMFLVPFSPTTLPPFQLPPPMSNISIHDYNKQLLEAENLHGSGSAKMSLSFTSQFEESTVSLRQSDDWAISRTSNPGVSHIILNENNSVKDVETFEALNNVSVMEGERRAVFVDVSEIVTAHSKMHSLVCTAFFINFLLIQSTTDTELLSKQFPAFRLSSDLSSSHVPLLPSKRNYFLSDGKNRFKKLSKLRNSESFTLNDGVAVMKGTNDLLRQIGCLNFEELKYFENEFTYISTGLRFAKSGSSDGEEIRFRLHHCCNKSLQAILSKGASCVSVLNQTKAFPDLLSCSCAVFAVMVNCTLRNNIPWGRDRLVYESAPIIDSVASNIVQIVSFQVKVPGNLKARHSPMTPSALIESIYNELDFLHRSTIEDRSDNNNMIFSNLLQTVRLTLLIPHGWDPSASQGAEQRFTIQHRNAVCAFLLLLVTLFTDGEIESSIVASQLDRITNCADKDVFGPKDAIAEGEFQPIPTDADELLLQICPQIIPAVFACELLRQLIEKGLQKAKFLHQFAVKDPEVSELQHLNIGETKDVETELWRHRNAGAPLPRADATESAHRDATDNFANTDPPSTQSITVKLNIKLSGSTQEPLTSGAGDARNVGQTKKRLRFTDNATHSSARAASKAAPSEVQNNAVKTPSKPLSTRKESQELHKQRSQTQQIHATSSVSATKANSKALHLRWLMDIEMYLQVICRQIYQLVKPYALSPPPILDRIIASVSSLTLPSGLEELDIKRKQLAFPLTSSLAYRIINHVENVRLLAVSHSQDGEQKVQQTFTEYFEIIDELRIARDKVSAMHCISLKMIEEWIE